MGKIRRGEVFYAGTGLDMKFVRVGGVYFYATFIHLSDKIGGDFRVGTRIISACLGGPVGEIVYWCSKSENTIDYQLAEAIVALNKDSSVQDTLDALEAQIVAAPSKITKGRM